MPEDDMNLPADKGGPEEERKAPLRVSPDQKATGTEPMANAPGRVSNEPESTATAPQGKAPAADSREPEAVRPRMAGASSGERTPRSAADITGKILLLGSKPWQVARLISSGYEAEMFIVSDGEQQLALKLFRKGFSPNKKVLPLLKTINGKGFITDIHDTGTLSGTQDPLLDGLEYELMDYCPLGAASGFDLKGNKEAILAIAVKTALALEACHKAGFVHKDIKPANILIKDKDIFDSVICDFDIADTLKDGKVTTAQSRTPTYAAPELYDTQKAKAIVDESHLFEITPKADYYSLGMTILCLWSGESAFRSKETEMAVTKLTTGIKIPPDMPERLATIAKGLLIKNPAKRWDYEEIRAFLSGETVSADEGELLEDLNIVFNAGKHLTANTTEELARCLLDDFELGKRYLYKGKLHDWLSGRPEIQDALEDIVEVKYPHNQYLGTLSAVFILDPGMVFPLTGARRDDFTEYTIGAGSPQEIADFCSDFFCDEATKDLIVSSVLTDWLSIRDKDIAERVSQIESIDTEEIETLERDIVFRTRVQTIDPLCDARLCNDKSDPNYVMTGERLGWLMNLAFQTYYVDSKGSVTELQNNWNAKSNAAANHLVDSDTIVLIIDSFLDYKNSYLERFFKTKGNRFKEQDRTMRDVTDYDSKTNRKKAGPKDAAYLVSTAVLKAAKAFGWTPEYRFHGTQTVVKSVEGLENCQENKTEALRSRSLEAWLAVQYQENPFADLSEKHTYEDLLEDFTLERWDCDDDDRAANRYLEARDEVLNLYTQEKKRIRWTLTRAVLQKVFAVLLIFVPLALLAVLVLQSGLSHPKVDVSAFNFKWAFCSVGLIAAALVFFFGDTDGCGVPIVIGLAVSGVAWLLVKFLGPFIIWFYLASIIAVIVFLSIKVIFNISESSKDNRAAVKPGFEELSVEPLYYAYSNEKTFKSSVNALFRYNDLEDWKQDISKRRLTILISFGITVLMCLGAALLPDSGRKGGVIEKTKEKIEQTTNTQNDDKAL